MIVQETVTMVNQEVFFLLSTKRVLQVSMEHGCEPKGA